MKENVKEKIKFNKNKIPYGIQRKNKNNIIINDRIILNILEFQIYLLN